MLIKGNRICKNKKPNYFDDENQLQTTRTNIDQKSKINGVDMMKTRDSTMTLPEHEIDIPNNCAMICSGGQGLS